MIVGGAKPARLGQHLARRRPGRTPSGRPSRSCTSAKRSTGSSRPTGSGAHIAATWLPSAPRSASARTRDRHHRLAARARRSSTPRRAQVAAERRRRRREHDVVDRAAERVLDRLEVLEVGRRPSRSAGAGRSARSAGCAARGRCRRERDRADGGERRRPRREHAARARAAPRARRATISVGTVARSTSASPSSWAPLGSGPRHPRRSGARRGAGSGAASNSTVVMSTPEMPSTSAWWVLASSAKRSPLELARRARSPTAAWRGRAAARTRARRGA